MCVNICICDLLHMQLKGQHMCLRSGCKCSRKGCICICDPTASAVEGLHMYLWSYCKCSRKGCISICDPTASAVERAAYVFVILL